MPSCFYARRLQEGRKRHAAGARQSKRVAGGVIQKHVLHLSRSRLRTGVAPVHRGARPGGVGRTLALFPEDRSAETAGRLDRPAEAVAIAALPAAAMSACSLALSLWEELRLDRFWSDRLPASRKGTRWDRELSCSSPTGCWRRAAVAAASRVVRADRARRLAGRRFRARPDPQALRCHDRLLEHKEALFHHLTER